MKKTRALVLLTGRLLIVYIYLTSGLAKVFGWRGNVEYMSVHRLPMIPLLLASAAFIELAGSLCLATGWQARRAALLLFGYTAILTFLLHDYWAYTGAAAAVQETHFRKNLAIMGGLLALSVSGPGTWSIGRQKAADA